MSTSFLSANMSLVVPIVNVEIGPNWANDLNASLLIIDAHNHNPGAGVQITPAGLNINTDLTFNSNNAIALRSTRFTPQGSPLAGGSDLGCLYEAGVDLYYNDGAGNQIRITQSGSVAGSAGTITGLPSGTASAAFQSASGTFQFQQATSTGANIDVASVIIRYPGSYPTPSGNAIILEAPSALASQYSLTLPALPGQTNVMTLTSGGIISSITYDAVGVAMSSTGADAIASSMSSSGANAIAVTSNNANLTGKAVKENNNNLIVSNTNATNSLSLVRGTVSAGSIISGEGFSVNHTGTGQWTITFSAAFNDTPVVVASLAAGSSIVGTIVTGNESTTSFKTFVNNGASFTDFTWSFIAIGQRT